jgi:hypothetical protein
MKLVCYELAKLAKEKGFDEVCIDTFDFLGKETRRYNISINESMTEKELQKEFEVNNTYLENIVKIGSSPAFIARPYDAQLQAWLREKGVDINIACISLKFYGIIGTKGIMYPDSFSNIKADKDTYEEKLEELLFKALNYEMV